MLLILAWFASNKESEQRAMRAGRRFDAAAAPLVPVTYIRHDYSGPGWGSTVWAPGSEGAYRWPAVADDDGVSAISLGIPVGTPVDDTPQRMAERLLAGADVHAGLVPPFGFVAIDRTSRRVAIAQDWLGMARLFTGESDGLVGFSNRPTLLARFLTGTAKPNRDGWISYALSGHFGGDSAPVESVRLMAPGERATYRPADRRISTEVRFALDDLVRAGLDMRTGDPTVALDSAAEALAGTAASVGRLYADPIRLGLSGGKDSRLIAAAFLAADRPLALHTNDDVPAEAQVAKDLVEIVRASRGVRLDHAVRPVGEPARVLDVGLHDRAVRLQRLHDFQYPASYLVRPASSAQLRPAALALSLTGAAGEIATGYWYPADPDESPEAVERAARVHTMAAVKRGAARAGAIAVEQARIAAILARAGSLGLTGLEQLDYVYLVERMRRWSSVAYNVGEVAPFLTPALVSATFCLTAAQKRDRMLHTGLLSRFVPEWMPVPFVSGSSGPSRATHIWDGDGIAVMRRLLADRRPGGLTDILRHSMVAEAIDACAAGVPDMRQQSTLQSFVALAAATDALEPRPWTLVAQRQMRRTTRPAVRIVRQAVRKTMALGRAEPRTPSGV